MILTNSICVFRGLVESSRPISQGRWRRWQGFFSSDFLERNKASRWRGIWRRWRWQRRGWHSAAEGVGSNDQAKGAAVQQDEEKPAGQPPLAADRDQSRQQQRLGQWLLTDSYCRKCGNGRNDECCGRELENISNRLGQETLTCIPKHSHTPSSCLSTNFADVLLSPLSPGTDSEGAIWKKRVQIVMFFFLVFFVISKKGQWMSPSCFVFLQKKTIGLYLTHIKGPIFKCIQRCTRSTNSPMIW